MNRIVNDNSLTSVANAIRSKGGTSADLLFPDGFVSAIQNINPGFNTQSKTGIIPTESSVTVTPDTGYDALSSVQINGISSTYVGSDIDRNDSTDLTASGATVSVPAGYYASTASKSVSSGTEGTPSASKGTVSNHSVTVTPSVTNSAGYIFGGTKTGTAVTVTVSELESGSKSITQNGTDIDVSGYSMVDVAVPGATLQAKTGISPTTSSQTIEPDDGYDGLSSVQINAMPSGSVTAPATISGTSASVSTGTNTLTLSKTLSVTPNVTTAGYISSGTAGNSNVSLTASVNTRSSSSLTASGATVTAPAGYYAESASKSVASGSEGTPSATKGTVINHSVSVTPSVTNTEGYISGGTKTGTAVTVTVSELESGTKTISSNGTGISVSGYSTVDVIVPEPELQDKTGVTPSTSSQTITADTGYDGLSSVQIDAMPSGSVTAPASISGSSATVSTGTNTLTLTKTVSVTPNVTTAGYVSSGTAGNSSVSLTASVNTRSSTDLTVSGATVTAPAGYYASNASKSVATGTVTAPSSISGSSATVSTGTNTLTFSKTISVTPSVTTAGYISNGTAGNSSVSLTASITTKAAATYYTSTTDQTITSGQYLTGVQTIKAVTVSGLSADKVLSGTTVNIGDSSDADRIMSVSGSVVIQHYYTGTGTPASSLGVNGDIYLKTS